MEYQSIILIILLIILLSLNYLSLSKRTKAMEIINKMGIGYNLANLFDNFDPLKELIDNNMHHNPNDLITLYGSQVPTKQMIKNIKKNGFRTIRFPVTWMYFIDDLGNIDSKWMSRIKEVVDWIINLNMFCILTIHSDTHVEGGWFFNYYKSKDKYYHLWSQIAKEFQDYNEYLIFESMDEGACQLDYSSGSHYIFDYNKFLNLTQNFVDIVRKCGSYNKERLLLISGMQSSIEYTCINEFKIPIDKYNKIAISLHYFEPISFTKETSEVFLRKEWGNIEDYNELIHNFEKIKYYFIDKGYPVILTEIGVPTNQLKDIKSIREYLYSVFALSVEQNGIIPCLWDTSTKYIKIDDNSLNPKNIFFGYYCYYYNYYNREDDKWYDEKIKNIFTQISYKKYDKINKFYKTTKLASYYKEKSDDILITVNFGDKKIVKIFFNIKIIGKKKIDENYFSFLCEQYNNPYFIIIIYKIENIKKQYDGTFDISLKNIDERCYNKIYFYEIAGQYILNNITIEYSEEFQNFDYKSYQKIISRYIN